MYYVLLNSTTCLVGYIHYNIRYIGYTSTSSVLSVLSTSYTWLHPFIGLHPFIPLHRWHRRHPLHPLHHYYLYRVYIYTYSKYILVTCVRYIGSGSSVRCLTLLVYWVHRLRPHHPFVNIRFISRYIRCIRLSVTFVSSVTSTGFIRRHVGFVGYIPSHMDGLHRWHRLHPYSIRYIG